MYGHCDHIVGSVGIELRTGCQEVLQKRQFADNKDKGYNNGPIIDHLNESFQVVFSNMLGQSIDQRTFLDEAILENETYKMGTYMVVSMC